MNADITLYLDLDKMSAADVRDCEELVQGHIVLPSDTENNAVQVTYTLDVIVGANVSRKMDRLKHLLNKHPRAHAAYEEDQIRGKVQEMRELADRLEELLHLAKGEKV